MLALHSVRGQFREFAFRCNRLARVLIALFFLGLACFCSDAPRSPRPSTRTTAGSRMCTTRMLLQRHYARGSLCRYGVDLPGRRGERTLRIACHLGFFFAIAT